MSKKLVLLIFVLFLVQIAECTKHHKHSHQNNELTDQHEFIPFKNAKKVRIPQKKEFKIKDFISSMNSFAGSIQQFFGGFFNQLALKKQKPLKRQSVIYRENFASQNGGAQILMVSSSKIKSPKAILRNDPDAYLFTADELPITIVIGLKEEILIDSFVVQSGEVYSCIVQDFQLEGAFSLQKEEWILLGNFTAENSFEAQEFAVEQRIIRYLRLTILSSYGKWKYFTLSEIGVYGEGLFSHAMESLLQADYKTSEQGMNNTSHLQSKKHKNKFSNKQIHTKEILVEAFTEVAGEQNTKTQKDTNLQESKLNDSQTIQKPTSKEKKSVSNLKKKVNYLEKRNYQLHQQIKQMKKLVAQKLNQLQAKYHGKDSNQNHHISNSNQQNWYSFLLDSHSTILFCVVVNLTCLMLAFCFVLKSKKSDNNKDKEQNNRKIKIKMR